MSWKKILDREEYIFDPSVDDYLIKHGFYFDKMSPKYMNDDSDWNNISYLNAKCLRLDASNCNDDTWITIYFNTDEVYLEVEDSCGFKYSHREPVYETSWSIQVVDRILDEITRWV